MLNETSKYILLHEWGGVYDSILITASHMTAERTRLPLPPPSLSHKRPAALLRSGYVRDSLFGSEAPPKIKKQKDIRTPSLPKSGKEGVLFITANFTLRR